MNEQTINNALLELARRGGLEGRLAEVLLEVRGVGWSGMVQSAPFVRGQSQAFILGVLQDGPLDIQEIVRRLRVSKPILKQGRAYNSVYQALIRLEEKGHVARDGTLWCRL